ncbi:competence protein ComF [Oceanicola sp. 22II-s10i]|uniref:double zinc ribbon domain-containing protein n=1 Tax=Oceanicola sp. 22II-s10i TaxID=1317116 RepID=UPI000B5274DD|nr:double zinc ribbon domain-containing protein [Oceanicola sp. 22II-s10i]OWU86010.1 competence protein ComF [Oceanicola sp. 22II-s10i]
MPARANFQTVLRVVYPPRCLTCGEMVESDFGLCGPCWRDTPFIDGFRCDLCGLPLPGGRTGEVAQCDDCMIRTRPWRQGRAAMLYDGNARRLVLALKHGDRQDLARPCGHWMAQALHDVDTSDLLVAPVPLSRRRLIRRRYNQSALLARALAAELGAEVCPDLLIRTRHTPVLDGLGAEARFTTLDGAIAVHPRREGIARGKRVLIVDDVMTAGATLTACTMAALGASAQDVTVALLARVAKGA